MRSLEKNAVFVGDNLKVLDTLARGSFDLIYCDPPFGTGKDFQGNKRLQNGQLKYSDKFLPDETMWRERDRLEVERYALKHVFEFAQILYGLPRVAFLVFVCQRLLACQKVLKVDGSIYVHVDDHNIHLVRLCMDAIFGQERFGAHISWKRTFCPKNACKGYGRVTDHLLMYSGRGNRIDTQAICTPLTEEYIAREYPHRDARGRYAKTGSLYLSGTVLNGGGEHIEGNERYLPWRGVNPKNHGLAWCVPLQGKYAQWIEKHIPGFSGEKSCHKRLDLLYEHDFLCWANTPKGKNVQLKRYLAGIDGLAVSNFWDDVSPIGSGSHENAGYPTQKPLALLERIVKASSKKGDWVLDPFMGSGTTLMAAEGLGRHWVGIDISPHAADCFEQRQTENWPLFKNYERYDLGKNDDSS